MESLTYFKALADETRIRLIHILLHHELKVGELVTILEMGQSRISRHLKILADAGLVQTVKEGVWGFYSVPESGPGRAFLNAVRYVFEGEALLADDLKRARQIIDARSRGSTRFFDHIAPNWDLLKQDILGPFDLKQAIFREAGHRKVGTDLGCGTGELLDAMKNHTDKAIGVDRSPRMLEEARKRFAARKGDNVEFRLGEIEHLPLGDNEADLAVISLVLQYLEEPRAAVAEVARILKPRGEFVLAEFARHQQETFKSGYGVKWLGFDPETIRNWLSENGFSVNRVDAHELANGLTLNIFRSAKTAQKK